MELEEILEIKKKLLETYDLDKYGLIATPGKFGGHTISAPYFYELILDGASDQVIYDEYDRPIDIFVISKNEKKAFPELRGIYAVACWETDDGSFEIEYFRKKSELNSFIKEIEEYALQRSEEE